MFDENNFTDRQKDQILIEILRLKQTLNSTGLILINNIHSTLEICKKAHIKLPDEEKLVKILAETQYSEFDFSNKINEISKMVDFFREENKGRTFDNESIPDELRWWK